MNNFLAVFDGYKMKESTLLYAIQLTKDANAHLTGVFLDDFLYHTYNVSKVVFNNNDYRAVMQELDETDKTMRDKAAQDFQKACNRAHIHFSIHHDKSIALQELKHESLFADLVIINENETFSNTQQQSPTAFIKDLLCDVHCPVFVVPDEYKPLNKVVLLYDGEPSSLHAIKMYSYLLGNTKQLPVEVFTVKEESIPILRLPENKLMRGFIKSHFTGAQYTIISGDSEEQVISHLKENMENKLIVLGAYGRSTLSRWFKDSMGDLLLKELNVPLFIAHEN